MSKGFSIRLLTALIMTFPLLFGASACVADDAVRIDTLPFHVRPAVLENHDKSVRIDSSTPNTGVSAMNTAASDTSKTTESTLLPERRGSVQDMLQSHEFTFANPRKRALNLKDGSTSNGLDLDAVKLRLSRDKVLVRVEFSFN
jgi:hypothetical protein